MTGSFWQRLAEAAERIAGHATEAWQEIRSESRQAIREARAEFHQKKREDNHPVGERVSDGEAAELIAWYHSLARPALLWTATPVASAETGARLGGPAWFADHEQWPKDARGRRLEFVAQIDFARLPPLGGFPTAGVVRFFVGRDDIFGVNFDAPDHGDICVLWHPGPVEGGRHEPPAPWAPDEGSPFMDDRVRTDGKAFETALVSDLPDSFSLEVQTKLEGQGRRPGISELEDELFNLADTRPYGHRIGGHPTFTQSDFRLPGRHDEFDTVLLALTSDESIMWGDVGEAVFMMRAKDLARCDFSLVAFYWDCH